MRSCELIIYDKLNLHTLMKCISTETQITRLTRKPHQSDSLPHLNDRVLNVDCYLTQMILSLYHLSTLNGWFQQSILHHFHQKFHQYQFRQWKNHHRYYFQKHPWLNCYSFEQSIEMTSEHPLSIFRYGREKRYLHRNNRIGPRTLLDSPYLLGQLIHYSAAAPLRS